MKIKQNKNKINKNIKEKHINKYFKLTFKNINK